MAEPVEFVSPLSRDQCAARLRAVIDSQWTWDFSGSRAAIGWVTEDRLQIRKRIPFRNSFQPILKAKLEPEGTRTRLICRTSLSRIVLIFMAFWFAIVLPANYMLVVRPVLTNLTGFISGKPNVPLAVSIMLPLMLLFGIGMVALGLYAARGERKFLFNLVRKTVDAPLTGSSTAPDRSYRTLAH